MLNTKIFTLESSDGSDINIGIIEKLRDEHTLLFTWESSQMMSAYILNNKQLFANSSVLEIGAGVGLPSLTCGHAAINAKRVVITERSDEEGTLQHLQQVIALNKQEAVCSVSPLSWDLPDTWPLEPFDYILGSDVLYSSEDFAPLLDLLSHLFSLNPLTEFLTTYKNRSSRRTLAPHLLLHGMRAEVIPVQSFLHSCHSQSGACLLETKEVSSTGSLNTRHRTHTCDDDDDSYGKRSLKRCKHSFDAEVSSTATPVQPEYTLKNVSVFDETYMIRIVLAS